VPSRIEGSLSSGQVEAHQQTNLPAGVGSQFGKALTQPHGKKILTGDNQADIVRVRGGNAIQRRA
jgi:hypothetical protein